MADVTIRPAVADDAPAILRFIQEVAVAGGSPVETVRSTVESIRQDGFGDDPRFETLMAEMNGEPVGCVVFYRKYNTWVGGSGLHIEDIAVDEGARGMGIGRRLMAAVARIAVERHYRLIDLAVEPGNPARAFYERLGMHEHGGWVPYRMTLPALHELAAGAPAIDR